MTPEFEIINFKRFRLNVVANARIETLHMGLRWVEGAPVTSYGFAFSPDWTSAADGVHCYAPDGELIGKIHFPEIVTNLTFGGPKRNRLFISAASSL